MNQFSHHFGRWLASTEPGAITAKGAVGVGGTTIAMLPQWVHDMSGWATVMSPILGFFVVLFSAVTVSINLAFHPRVVRLVAWIWKKARHKAPIIMAALILLSGCATSKEPTIMRAMVVNEEAAASVEDAQAAAGAVEESHAGLGTALDEIARLIEALLSSPTTDTP